MLKPVATILVVTFFLAQPLHAAPSTHFPQIMNHASLMQLSPAKRAQYLKTLAALINDFETKTSAKISSEDYAMLNDFKELIAQEAAILPQADAEQDDPATVSPAVRRMMNQRETALNSAETPVLNDGAWSCASKDSSVVMNMDVGTCVRGSGGPKGKTCDHTGDKSVQVITNPSKGQESGIFQVFCVPAQSFNILSADRQKALQSEFGTQSVASSFIVSDFAANKAARAANGGYFDRMSPSAKQDAINQARNKLFNQNTVDVVAGGLPELQKTQLLSGNPLNTQNPSVQKSVSGDNGAAAGQNLPAGADKCMPKTCPTSKKEIAAARKAYRKSAAPDCIVGGNFSSYSAPPVPKGCKFKQSWGGTDVCKKDGDVAAYRQTVCNPILWCKKGADGKTEPFCERVTGSVSASCAAKAKTQGYAIGADCSGTPGVSEAYNDFMANFKKLCAGDTPFKGMFCGECKVMAEGIARANAAATTFAACDPNTAADGQPADGKKPESTH